MKRAECQNTVSITPDLVRVCIKFQQLFSNFRIVGGHSVDDGSVTLGVRFVDELRRCRCEVSDDGMVSVGRCLVYGRVAQGATANIQSSFCLQEALHHLPGRITEKSTSESQFRPEQSKHSCVRVANSWVQQPLMTKGPRRQ